jgi:hypothetical protein
MDEQKSGFWQTFYDPLGLEMAASHFPPLSGSLWARRWRSHSGTLAQARAGCMVFEPTRSSLLFTMRMHACGLAKSRDASEDSRSAYHAHWTGSG